MTVAQLVEALSALPGDAVIIMQSDGGLSQVNALDFIEASGPGAPAEVILMPHMDE